MSAYTGTVLATLHGQLDLLNPDPGKVSWRAIAKSLSRQCRYTGHTKWHYSVAQHSVLLYYHFLREYGTGDQKLARAILIHDAHEAYVGDMGRPIRNALYTLAGDDWFYLLEESIQRTIFEKAGVPHGLVYNQTLKSLDDRISVDEMRELLPTAVVRKGLEGLGIIIHQWGMEEAEEEYLFCLSVSGVDIAG